MKSTSKDVRSALLMALFLVAATSLVAVASTLVGGLLFPSQATGSLVYRDGRVIGSALLGQRYDGDRFFHGRPALVAPLHATGSNLAPTNPALRARILADAEHLARREGIAPTAIPPDLLAASGSGVDPHITPAAAAIQIARVARARGLPPAAVQAAVQRHTEGPWLGLFGHARVDVLGLNLELERGPSPTD